MRNIIRAIILVGLATTLSACTGFSAFTTVRTAALDLSSRGNGEGSYLLFLGKPDLNATLPEYLSHVDENPGHYNVEFADFTLTFSTAPQVQSYYLWQACYPKRSPREYKANWLSQYEFRDCVFLFYDARAAIDRKEDTDMECYAFGFRDGRCVVKFHFPWNLGDVHRPTQSSLIGATPESIAARIKIGMARSAVEELIKQVRRGDQFYWRDGGIGPTKDGYNVGDGVVLWLTYGDPHDPLNPSPDDKLTAVEIAHFDDLKPKISPELFAVIHLLNDSPDGDGYSFNPVKLIRCVNRLHALGKEKAIRVLREYAQFTQLSFGGNGQPDNREQNYKFCLNDQNIRLITRLLFVRADGNPQMPEMPWMALGFSDRAPDRILNDFPLYPLAVEGDIPFELSAGAVSGGGDYPSPLEDLDYCEKNCKLRKDLLLPIISPIEAANTLINSARWKQLFKNQPADNENISKQLVRMQALRSVEELFNGENFVGKPGAAAWLDEATWTKYIHDKRLQNPKWDSVKQAFIQPGK